MNARRLRLIIVFLTVALVVPVPGTDLSTGAGDGKTKENLEDAGKEIKELGKKIGQAGKEFGLEVADGAKQVWYKGLRVSEPLLKDVQKRTRRFWAEMIEAKERTRRELEQENRRLRKRLAEREAG